MRFEVAVRQVVSAASPSVVRVFFGEGDMLTGTLISADGTVLTCAHLPVPVGETVTIGLFDGRRTPAKVISKLPDVGESVERLWAYLRSHYLSNRVYDDYRHLLDAGAQAWRQLTPETLRSVCSCPYLGHEE